MPEAASARPRTVECSVRTVPASGTAFFTASSPAPHTQSWNWATARCPFGLTLRLYSVSMTSPQAYPNMARST